MVLHVYLRTYIGEPEIPFTIQLAFLLLACLCAIVRNTSFRSILPALIGTATEGATQVGTLGIGRLGEKEYPAMATSLQVVSQVRIGPKDCSQGIVVGSNGTANFTLAVPVRTKFIKCRDFY